MLRESELKEEDQSKLEEFEKAALAHFDSIPGGTFFGDVISHDDPRLFIDVDEQFFAQLALEKVLPNGSIVHVVESANQPIAYMIGEGKYADRDRYPFPRR